MAFKASTKRERRRQPLALGKSLGPSAAVRTWAESQVNAVVKAMIDDYRLHINRALSSPEVEHFYAQDAAAASTFSSVLNQLQRKWQDVFRGFARKYAEEFVEKVDEHSKSSTWFSLTTAGVEQPRMTYSTNIANTTSAAKDFNFTLVTNVQEEVHEKIYSSVMLSLTSPNPEEQGASGIQNALHEVGITAKKRVELITRDQTSKLYTSLSSDRLKQNGCEHFKWIHSSAGKVPRQTHVDKNGEIFEINDPKLWEGPKADQGPPGWAINCRCRMMPVFGYTDDDEEED